MNVVLRENDLVFAKVKSNAIIPTKDLENAGYDIYACFEEDYMIIPPYSTKLIPTGIASATSDKYYLQVHERGSTGSKGMKYGAGVIDSSYRGEIFVCINNVNNKGIIISKLNKDDLIRKYSVKDEDGDVMIPYGNGYHDRVYFWEDDEDNNPIIYSYTKAIAQLVVHEVPVMNTKEISYEELLQIPSNRGTGKLGSSNK